MLLQPSHTQPRSELVVSNGIMQSEHLANLDSLVSLQDMEVHRQRKPPIRCADFIQQVMVHLPAVATFIDESDIGIVHLEVGAMKLATLDAFARSDFTTARKHFSLIADLFNRAEATLYDAIRISYLEALFLGEVSAVHFVARKMLPEQLANALMQSELHLEKRQALQKKSY